ncbi:MAG: DUF5683 domain-containing protein [Rikenellaceae bacterium]|jgi:hypothetical protein
MSRKFLISVTVMLISFPLSAQITGRLNTAGPPGANLFQQQTTTKNDSTEYENTPRVPRYTIKRYFKSLAHKDSMRINHMWMGSLVLPGTAQIYNKQYWKLPIVYGGMAALIYEGYSSNGNDREKFYIGAAMLHYATIMDGLVSYKYYKPILPARASLYSAMLPGLGQAYTGNYWKIPIIYGGLITCGYFINFNNIQYQKYKNLYIEAYNDPQSEAATKYSLESLDYFKTAYRRYRDYSILAGILVYALNIIDANVFAHFTDFDVSDDLSASFAPVMIYPLNNQFANNLSPTFGLQVNLNF